MTKHFFALIVIVVSTAVQAAMDGTVDMDVGALSKAFRSEHGAVTAAMDGNLYVEAEEFTPGGAWQALAWGNNYYAATFANTFLSRQAYLGAPAQCETSESHIEVTIPESGKYLLLARYEAAYRFQTQFRVVVEQNGEMIFDRLYGAIENPKIWAFSKGVTNQVAWEWGACENIVWEGHDAWVSLTAGPAVIRLVAGPQPEPAAKRNIDILMLTRDEEEIQRRIDKENYLPLDGLLTQQGDLYIRLHNHVESVPLKLTYGPGREHSPYWVHLRNWPRQNETPIVEPGGHSDWIEVGSVLDTLNSGRWDLRAISDVKDGPIRYRVEFAVPEPNGGHRIIADIEQFDPALELGYFGDTRYSNRLLHRAEVLDNLLATIETATPGIVLPERFPVFGYSFDEPSDREFLGADEAAHRRAAIDAFHSLFGLNLTHYGNKMATYHDVRGVKTDALAEHLAGIDDVRKQTLRVVSQGDEISLPRPAAGDHAGFREWLKQKGISPSEALGQEGTLEDLQYAPGRDAMLTAPGLYYWSRRYAYDYGIAETKKRTDIIRAALPRVEVGANFSPHHGGSAHSYLGEVYKWVRLFREDGMTMPWSEDYVWQLPVGSPQMNMISLELFRAGIRHRPADPIHFYVMPHWPGTSPNMWRRMFYSCLAHGVKQLNLFEFRPVQDAYTENYVNLPDTYIMVRRTLGEMAGFEDYIMDGAVMPAKVGLWFSETADIWQNNNAPHGAAKRSLYLALRHAGPLDFIIEKDALDGTLDAYQTLYLTDRHVSVAAAEALARWVEQGGRLLLTAGAGQFDEYNRPNEVMRELIGGRWMETRSAEGPELHYLKQDLPFAQPITNVRVGEENFAVYGECVALPLVKDGEILATFDDGSPATIRLGVGQGRVTICGFLPGLSYLAPALPKRPADRGTHDDAYAHFLPTDVDKNVAELLSEPAKDARAMTCSDGLVDFHIIESPHGWVIPMASWRDNETHTVTLTWNNAPSFTAATLATGGPVDVTRDGGDAVMRFDLTLADAIVLKK